MNLQVAVEIGRTTLPIRDVLALTPGSIVELDKLAGEKVDVLINGRPIAQGEVVVVDLTPGSIIELDKMAGEKVDILINGRPIAQGEVVVVDEKFGVRITDVVARQQRLSPLGR